MNTNRDYLSSFIDISDEMFSKLTSVAEFKEVEAGTELVKLGEIPSKIYLLRSGLIRCYLITEDGKEFNKSFYLPISFVASLTALLRETPSIFVFEAVTACKYYEIDNEEFMKLCSKDPNINTMYCRILERIYSMYEKRLVDLISLDAKGRYRELKKQIPEVDELIPQYHIASYLGITPVQLSRIRKKL